MNRTSMDTYIIRIYRCTENRPDSLVGTVENVSGKVRTAFANIDELWEIINLHTPDKNEKKSAVSRQKDKQQKDEWLG